MRQYIGARYVPKFFDNNGSTDWVSGIAYEPLTIVTYLGNSYTSKKPVPVGVDILDSDYWASTGIWNSQVEQYRQEVETLQTVLTKKRYILIGDSYGENRTVGGDTITGWCENLKNYLVSDGSDCYTNPAGGAAFGYIDANHKTFKQLLEEIAVTDPETISDIIVCGGANEANSTPTDIRNGIKAFSEYAKEHFPNAKIHVGWLAWSTNANKTTYNSLIEYYRQACINNTDNYMVYLSNVEYVLHNYNYLLSDGLHPNNTGTTKIAVAIAESIFGNANVEHEIVNPTITYDAAFDNTADVQLIMSSKNDVIRFGFVARNNSLHYVTPDSYYSKTVKIGNVGTNTLVRASSANQALFTCNVRIFDSSNNQHVYPAHGYIDVDGDLYIRLEFDSTLTVTDIFITSGSGIALAKYC